MTPGEIIHIKLTPKASSDRIGDTVTDAAGRSVMRVYVTAPPDKNKANEAMIRLLAAHYGVAASRIELLRGHASRDKQVRITP